MRTYLNGSDNYLYSESTTSRISDFILYSFFVLFLGMLYFVLLQNRRVDLIPFNLTILGFVYGLVVLYVWSPRFVSRYWTVLMIFSSFLILLMLFINPPGEFMFVSGDENTYYEFFKQPQLNPEVIGSPYLYIKWLQFWAHILDWKSFRFVNIGSYLLAVTILLSILKERYGKDVARLGVFLLMFSPLEIWFTNSYYKESFYVLLFSMFIWCLHKEHLLLSVAFLVFMTLVRPYSAVFIIPILLYLSSSKDIEFPRRFVVILIMFLVLGGIVYYLGNIAINAFYKWTIYRGIVTRGFGGTVFSNILALISSMVISVFLPLPYLVVTRNSTYWILDYVGYFEGFLSIIILPYALSAIVKNFRALSFRKHVGNRFTLLLIWLYLAMIVGIGLSGYVFTYRHYVGFKWILYSLASVERADTSMNTKNRIIFTFVVFAVIVILNAWRYLFPRQ